MSKRKYMVASGKSGGEPVWESKKNPTQGELAKALNWYNSNKDEKDAAKYLGVPVNIARDFQTAAWVTRMLTRGFKLPKVSKQFYETRMKDLELIKQRKGATDEDSPDAVSIQDRIRNKSEEIIGEMEGLVDDFGIRGSYKDMNAYQWMVDNDVKPIHAGRIINHFRAALLEPYTAAQGKDKQLVEGYSSYGKKRLMNLLHCYSAIIKDAEKLSQNVNKSRKPRKRKPVSHEKMVSKLNYKIKEDSLKLQSVDPVRIVGAQQLWIYNTKTRKLGVYNALDNSGLSLKGSTIKNFGVDSSISKTLRKPEKVLPTVVEGGKVSLRKIMDGINAKPTKMTGRINKDTLLLRVS